jgi:hypothetical protein
MVGSSALFCIAMIVVMFLIFVSVSFVNAVIPINNTDFSIGIPNYWAYEVNLFSNVALTPKEFAALHIDHNKPLNEKMHEGGAFASFEQDWLYGIKNAGFDVCVKYKIGKQNAISVTSQENLTIDNEPAVKITADGINSFLGIKFTEYMIWHNEKPYYIGYMANVKDYQKYLPEFEQIVKSFKFTK